jgi:hypothetical protein
MRRIALRALALPLALLWLPIFGCTMKGLPIRLVGFRAGDVDGIWLWRLSPSDGHYVRACRISFSNPYFRNGVELVSYDEYCLSGQYTKATLEAQVQRLPSDPTSINLQLVCQLPEQTSTYRASSYNSAGESPLSSSTIQL